MKIGNYVSHVAVMKGYERNVSGHIQVPLQSMRLLKEAGHDVHLITNRYPEGFTMPDFMPSGVAVHQVVDGRRRGGLLTRAGGHTRGVRPFALMQQMRQIVRTAHEQEFDVLHFWGFNRTANLAGALRWMGLRTPVAMTLFGANFPERLPRPLSRALWKRVDAVVSATEHVARRLGEEGIPATVVRHGVIRDLRAERADETIDPPHRVLYWRDASAENGADVCLQVFDRVAPNHPEISFDLAIRPHWDEVEGVDELAARHPNVHVYRYPYENGITLSKLVLESLCVMIPIRRMSIDPQLAIAESMAAGVAVVATDQRSNPELITPGRNGMLAPIGDVEATTRALETVIEDREKALQMCRNAREDTAKNWNWKNYVEQLTAVYERVRRR